jgi:uncharacterized membrane protein
MRWVLAGVFVAAGVAHLEVPNQFLKIKPNWMPYAQKVIFLRACSKLQLR